MILAVLLMISLLAGTVAFLVRRHSGWASKLSLAFQAVHFVVAVQLAYQVLSGGILTVVWGSWPAPFGILFVADALSVLLVASLSLVALLIQLGACSLFSNPKNSPPLYSLLHFLVMGATGAFLTGDLFNLYVWFEVILLSSFALMVIGADRRALKGIYHYVVMSLVGSLFFLTAAGLLYRWAGSLNWVDLALHWREAADQPAWLPWLSVFFLFAFGLKAAVVPLFQSLPASYPHLSPLIVAFLGGVLTKVGVYALIRVFGFALPNPQVLLLIVAGLTMVLGVLGALAQMSIRPLLSFHIISQVGYMIFGLAVSSRLALAAALFHLIHNMFVKTNLFLVGAALENRYGTDNLKKLGGMSAREPILTFFFLISAFALAGIPPLSGFFSKLGLVKAGFEADQWALSFVALAVGLLTTLSMVKIWMEAFWKEAPQDLIPRKLAVSDQPLYVAIGILCIVAIGMGLGAGYVMEWCLMAADQILSPELYGSLVFGREP
jgi:multicomponent Na+:H+ antiporter subunit D